MSAKSIRVRPAPDPDLPTRVSPTPGLPTWARKPSVYSSPDNMAASSGWTDDKDEEIGSNGSIAGLFVEDDEKVGFIVIQGCEEGYNATEILPMHTPFLMTNLVSA